MEIFKRVLRPDPMEGVNPLGSAPGSESRAPACAGSPPGAPSGPGLPQGRRRRRHVPAPLDDPVRRSRRGGSRTPGPGLILGLEVG